LGITSNGDFDSNIDEEEQSQEMDCLDGNNLPKVAFLALSFVSGLLADLGEAL
jgi:hypothetical protein